MKKRFLTITTALCLTLTVFTGCGNTDSTQSSIQSGTEAAGADSTSATADSTSQTNDSKSDSSDSATEEANDSETTTGMRMIVDTDKKKVAVNIPEGLYNEKNLKTDDLESEDSILYYSRFTAYRPDIDYSSASVSEMLFDIYVTDVSEDLAADDMTEAKYLDTMTVSIALQNSDIAREDNETHGQAEYRVLTYTGTAKDGTAYTVYTRMTVLNDCFIMFRAIEYNGSSLYVTYDDMSDIFDQVYDSVLVQNVTI